MPKRITPRRVPLLASYEVALARVVADPDRNLSKQPDVLRWTYDRTESLIRVMPSSEWTFDTTTTSWQDVVEELSSALLGSGDSEWR